MPKTYDVEDLVKDIETLLKASLVAKTIEVEAAQVAAGLPVAWESPSAPAIEAEAYHQFDWGENLNHAAGVAIFLAADPQTEGHGPFSKQSFVLDVGVYLSGTANDPTADRKLLRYSKAMKQLFEENWGKINPAFTRERVEQVGPIGFKFNVNSSDQCKIAGVTLFCTLG